MSFHFSRDQNKDEEIADLKTENNKKRKEPIKPWGKKERLLVFSVFLSTVLISAVLSIEARGFKLPGLPRLKLPKIDIGLDSEIIVVKKEDLEGVKQNKEKEDRVKISFKEATRKLSGVYGLYVERLNSGEYYGISQNEVFQAASLIKLPVIFALYKDSEQGLIDLEQKYVLKDSDKISGSGSLYGKPNGTVVTYRELARLMGKESDNTAFGIVRKKLGRDKIQSFISQIGMNKTSLDKNETTPEDIGLLWRTLWKGNILPTKDRDEILNYLTDTIYENWLKAGIPKDIRVAHKFGREVHILNDGGIIFSKSPFIAVIMSKGIVETEGDEAFPKLANIVYEAEKN